MKLFLTRLLEQLFSKSKDALISNKNAKKNYNMTKYDTINFIFSDNSSHIGSMLIGKKPNHANLGYDVNDI